MPEQEIIIRLAGLELHGILDTPEGSSCLVIFSHGSGSSRFSHRNRYVSTYLNGFGIATLLIDLLTIEEEQVYENRFNIVLLKDRLIGITEYILDSKEFQFNKIGYFGASTGAASALSAAADKGEIINAVVSRGGRPDLAYDSLSRVVSPVLLIIGSLDDQVLFLNKRAYEKLSCEKSIEVVQGATHLFEEPGTLEAVAQLSGDWFQKHFHISKSSSYDL
jgi:pimeloyl-ACP methyl ester carboxylesterase